MALAPNDHLVLPQVTVFQGRGRRLRNGLTASGERQLRDRDITEIHGLLVTTPLRTACDLGRLLHRDSALAALDALASLGAFTLEELVAEAAGFRGYRGVRQLRALALLADPGSESFGESVLRLRWYDAGAFPQPETQIEVEHSERGWLARIDLGSRPLRFGAEYDGERFHGADQTAHDQQRRAWLAEEGWTIEVFRREHLYGRGDVAVRRLRQALRLAMLRARRGRS